MVGPRARAGASPNVTARVGPLAAVAGLGLALGLLALAPFGFRLGWWGYPFALFSLMPASGTAAAAAIAIAVATVLWAWSALGWKAWVLLLGVMAVGEGVVYLPFHYRHLYGTLPHINDIATDTDDRTAFEAALAAREAESAGRGDTPEPELSRLQKAAYPDLAPLQAAVPVADVFAAALAVAKAMPGWTIVAVDAARGRIEATARTRWFAFTDDVVIRVRPAGGGSRVDLRSASRIGGHDIGANAARIRAYVAALRRAMRQ